MWLFNSKQSIADSALLSGATDWHCHLLPGVDDGVKTMKRTLEILDEYEKIGIKKVWFTPHIMEDMPNTVEGLQDRFREVKAEYKGPIDLRLAAENMLDTLFEERLQEGKLLPIGEEGTHLLVETSYFNPPTDLDGMLSRIMSKGYFPILAHPERYVYMDDSDYDRLRKMGIKFQLNLFSMVGSYGTTAFKKAETLLAKGYYDLMGSDTHRLSMFTGATQHKALGKKAIAKLKDLRAFE